MNQDTALTMDKAVISIKAATPEAIEEKEPEATEEVPKETTNEVAVATEPPSQPKEEPAEEIHELTKRGQDNTHVTITRGNHLLELPAGNYVVAGVFEDFNNAENESDRLFQRGFHEAKVGYLTAKGYYFVVVFESESLTAAQSERNRIRKMSGMSEVWVLKVNE